jgi:hypothetical protein
VWIQQQIIISNVFDAQLLIGSYVVYTVSLAWKDLCNLWYKFGKKNVHISLPFSGVVAFRYYHKYFSKAIYYRTSIFSILWPGNELNILLQDLIHHYDIDFPTSKLELHISIFYSANRCIMLDYSTSCLFLERNEGTFYLLKKSLSLHHH